MLKVVICALSLTTAVGTAAGQSRTYTLDADFDEGTLVNVNHDAPNNDQLQLSEQAEPFPFINVAASGRGTIVRINTDTGAIIGEYWTSPIDRFRNPSRTTVDAFGNVWAGNRDESAGGLGSVVKVGLVIGGTRVDEFGDPDPLGDYLAPPFDYNTCVDRHGATINDPPDGLIKTSRGLGDIRAWPPGTDGAGGLTALVEDADDECILIYQRVSGDQIRHVSVDADNNVWCGGHFGADNSFDLLDGDDGAILATFDVGWGGYGGFVDGNGFLWSSSRTPFGLLRYNTADGMWTVLQPAPDAYGLGLDTFGNVWHSQFTNNNINKWSPGGGFLGTFPTFGASGDRGVTVTPVDNNVWIANSSGSDVSRLNNAGTWLKTIPLGADGGRPTGVAVDSNGKVWVACLTGNSAKRIDPNAGGDNLGAVDLTVDLGAGAAPYNYSDMTGAVLLQAIQQGTWTVVYDSEHEGNEACVISWNGEPEGAEPPGTSITVEVRAADTIPDLSGETFEPVLNGEAAIGVAGRYWEIQATLARDPGLTITPVLSDLTIGCNEAPTIECPDPVTAECDSLDGAEVTLTVMVADTDGDDLTVTWEVDAIVVQVDNVPGGGPAAVPLVYTYAVGAHPVVVTVDDGKADPVNCVTLVIVEDTTAPVVTVADMSTMWPPNHKYRTFNLSDCVISVEDGCEGSLDVDVVGAIVSIYSDEPENAPGRGDGHTFDDIVILSPTSFMLRSERQGRGNGRVYGITFEVTDEADNTSTATCFIGVPHDRSATMPIDDGPSAGYTVDSPF